MEKRQREALAAQYEEEQKKILDELIELSFSFWDGTNNKYSLKTKKETSISHFLEIAVEILKKDFPEIRQLHSSAFIYVKEDIIIPYDYTFYDLIINDAKGRNGSLFTLTKKQDFDKDEGYVAKILERKWYEKNKHIFPANRWEIYDPLKNN
ncbi:unnamed protein product [Blepharisma stoltei]|uniref:FAM50A/XAP5 C-terminal domain-containing protein n=1 Tax=Blepharisma stoltei TaxID=1481888 RepID=A0AAU9K792_9CILI|nr:unnamed protein product [Blepharisma stoltei]